MADAPSVLFVGSPYWCRHLAGLYCEKPHIRAFTLTQAAKWVVTKRKVVCLVGLGMPDTYKRLLYHAAARVLEGAGIIRNRVVYWIGSDVLSLRSGSSLIDGCRNIAGSKWLADEVRDLGYVCEEALFPVRISIEKDMPFPDSDRLRVLCYIPDEHHDLHGSSEIKVASRKLTNVDFTVVGGNGSWWPDAPENVTFTGWTGDMPARIRESHVLLRRTAHDSLSAFVREGLVAGRHVIFTYECPGVRYVRRGDVEGLCTELGRLNAQLENSTFTRNRLDQDTWNWLTDTDTQLDALAAFYG